MMSGSFDPHMHSVIVLPAKRSNNKEDGKLGINELYEISYSETTIDERGIN